MISGFQLSLAKQNNLPYIPGMCSNIYAHMHLEDFLHLQTKGFLFLSIFSLTWHPAIWAYLFKASLA